MPIGSCDPWRQTTTGVGVVILATPLLERAQGVRVAADPCLHLHHATTLAAAL